MLHLAVILALAAEPGLPPPAGPAAIRETAPAARWPAALFFTGGGLTFWSGVGVAFGSFIRDPCRTAACPRRDNVGIVVAGAAVLSIGVASMLVGIFWLVWTRGTAEAGT